MPRAYIIGLVLLAAVAAGFSSRHYFKGVPVDVAPILGSESFYVLDVEGPNAETNNQIRKTLVRIDPDGTIHTIREIDATLEMSEQVAEEDRIVMYGASAMFYMVATGELSDLPRGYLYYDNMLAVEGRELDSLKDHPLVKDLPSLRIFRLPHQDCYMITASVPGTGGCTSTSEIDTVSGYGSETFSMRMPDFYWSVANMKRNTLTKVADNTHPTLSASGKFLVFHPYDENGKYYPRFVYLDEYVK